MLYRYPEEEALSESQMLMARAKEVETLELEIAVENMGKLFSYCIFTTILIISFPWALFVFDMALDWGMNSSLWMPIVLTSFSILLVYVLNMFMNTLARYEQQRRCDSSIIQESTVSPLSNIVFELEEAGIEK